MDCRVLVILAVIFVHGNCQHDAGQKAAMTRQNSRRGAPTGNRPPSPTGNRSQSPTGKRPPSPNGKLTPGDQVMVKDVDTMKFEAIELKNDVLRMATDLYESSKAPGAKDAPDAAIRNQLQGLLAKANDAVGKEATGFVARLEGFRKFVELHPAANPTLKAQLQSKLNQLHGYHEHLLETNATYMTDIEKALLGLLQKMDILANEEREKKQLEQARAQRRPGSLPRTGSSPRPGTPPKSGSPPRRSPSPQQGRRAQNPPRNRTPSPTTGGRPQTPPQGRKP